MSKEHKEFKDLIAIIYENTNCLREKMNIYTIDNGILVSDGNKLANATKKIVVSSLGKLDEIKICSYIELFCDEPYEDSDGHIVYDTLSEQISDFEMSEFDMTHYKDVINELNEYSKMLIMMLKFIYH